jgi:DNA-binding LacI/PurR family transcriptional regulator
VLERLNSSSTDEREEVEVAVRPTLQSIAERASVSRQTVSNVLNAPYLVHPDTSARVRAVIDEVGYRPHRPARQLRTRRSYMVGLRIRASGDDMAGAVLDRFLHAVTDHAQALGYRIMVFTASDDVGEILQYDELLDTVEIDGFVLTDTHHDDARTRWLTERGVPFVTFGRPWDRHAADASPSAHAWVDVDGSVGTRAAVEHLRTLGHRRIGFIGWPEGSDAGDDRRRGWHEAMAPLQLSTDELDALSVGVVDTVADGAQAAADVLGTVAPTALVCASDTLALGALAATRTGSDPAGPSTCAVVGFDDTPVAKAIGLSSVAQPLHEAAGWALRLLLEQLTARSNGKPPALPGQQVLLDPELVVRNSSTAPEAPDADP